MGRAAEVSSDAWFAEHPEALPAYLRVCDLLGPVGGYDVRVTKSQVAFRRRRGFAYLWLPGMYVGNDVVVLAVALARPVASDRFKEVVEPRPGLWMHHLEVHDLADLDDEVAAWLGEAAAAAS